MSYDQSKIAPQTFSIHFYDHSFKAHRSKSCTINLNIKQDLFKKVIKEKTIELMNMVSKVIFPCVTFGIKLNNFVKADFKNFEYDLLSYIKRHQNDAKEKSLINEKIHDVNRNLEGEILTENQKIIRCEKCDSMITEQEYTFHIDYHAALDLDKELNPNKKKYKVKNCQNNSNQMQNIDISINNSVCKSSSNKQAMEKSNSSKSDLINLPGQFPKKKLKKDDGNSKNSKLDHFFIKKWFVNYSIY